MDKISGCIFFLTAVLLSLDKTLADDYIIEGQILTTGTDCVTHYGVEVAGNNAAPCIVIQVQTTSNTGVYMVYHNESGDYFRFDNDSRADFRNTGAEVRFSTGSQGITETSELIDEQNPFFIIHGDDDPTNPTRCLDPSGDYEACNTSISRIFYIVPESCTVDNCTDCIPYKDTCNGCVDGYEVVDNVCQESCTDENCADCASDKDVCNECMDGYDLIDNACEVTTTTASGVSRPCGSFHTLLALTPVMFLLKKFFT